ncbi:phosphoesterase [Candidiatus Paracoxiella cheracis]|uniref:phosphoesterase n=1 Tax=Candidiatus Paracoxiella cheracis TaxID=3405120 RepID=UPI003BF5D383
MKKLITIIKKKSFKVGVAVAGVTLISLPLMSTANAGWPFIGGDDGKQSGDPFSGLVTAIHQVGNEMKALATASAKTANAMMYQIDSYFLNASQVNSQTDNAAIQARNTAANLTATQISNSLLQFPEEVVNPNELDNPELTALINNNKKVIPNLTVNTPASDTLYLDSSSDSMASTYGVAKPSVNYDNYFNFDSLITPAAYSNNQKKAAEAYIDYASQQYQSLTDGINFAKLKSELINLSPTKRAQKLQTIVNDPVYQKYQLTIRSLLASKSVALSNFNYLMAERTPVKGLAQKAGMPNNPNLPKGYASPLEVENYIANERLNNPEWAKAMETASPATVNREELMILAEIESQLQRNHLDHERLLATLSIMALQSAQLSTTTLKLEAQKVNGIIDPSQKQNTGQP